MGLLIVVVIPIAVALVFHRDSVTKKRIKIFFSLWVLEGFRAKSVGIGEDKCYAFLALLLSLLYDPLFVFLCFFFFKPAFILWHLVIYVTTIRNKAECK